MTLEEANFFKMLDEYARTRHRCFLLAEMDLNADQAHYALCFRPIGVEAQEIKETGLLMEGNARRWPGTPRHCLC